MTPEQLVERLTRQPSSDRHDMVNATRLRPINIERFNNNPAEFALNTDDYELLVAWFSGKYDLTISSWVRIDTASPETVQLGIRAEQLDSHVDYVVGQGSVGVKDTKAAGLGKDMPETSDLKWKALLEREKADEKAAKAARKAERKDPVQAVQSLMTFGASKPAART